ncbi:MAG: VWA domain-containing protein [Alphaproteobacteria bacterium]|nr:VWA domain-containing protein [Alphaproteobacteria bacterium]
MTRRPPGLLILTVALLAASMAAAEQPIPTGRAPLPVQGKHLLYQRVITRPGAMLAPSAGAEGAQPTPGFDVFYVYGRQNGWIEVGRSTDGRVAGWVAEDRTIEWKHAMVAEFANPANRSPVLFLRTAQDERDLLLDRNPAAAAERLRHAADAGQPGPLVAREPGRFVDILRNFYLLPVLSAEVMPREIGAPARVLEVISAPDNPPQAAADPEALRHFKASLVFLIDTTVSMQPYIDRTRDAIRAIVGQIAATPLRDKFRFGLIGYRDSLQDTQLLEYPTRVFAKPDFTQPPDAILPQIAAVMEASASSIGFDEDPIGGVKATLDEIDWGAVGGRYVILITDSGARPADHPHSVTHLNIADIKQEANLKGVSLFVVHLLTPQGAAVHDHERARAQYEQLSYDASAAHPLYFAVPGGSPEAFTATVTQLAAELVQSVARVTGVPVAQLMASGQLSPEQQHRIHVVEEAMRLAYVGRAEQAAAPDVVRSFTTDHDLANPEVPSLNIRVLLTRNQLSDLATALQDVLHAGLAGRTAPETFFSQLRATFAAGATDPARIRQIMGASSLGDLISEYVDDLPYVSQIMSISEQDWLAMGAMGQDQVLNDIQSKLRLYQEFAEHPEFWKDVTHSRSEGDKVFPVPLEALP